MHFHLLIYLNRVPVTPGGWGGGGGSPRGMVFVPFWSENGYGIFSILVLTYENRYEFYSNGYEF